MSPSKGHQGGSLGGREELSPQHRRRRKNARKREEQRWAAKSGPVTTKKAVPVHVVKQNTGTAHQAPNNSKELVMQQPTNHAENLYGYLTPPRGFTALEGDNAADPAVFVGMWIQQHGLDVALEWSRERGLEIRDGDGAPLTTQQVEMLIQTLHQLIEAHQVAATELEGREGK